MRKRLLLSAFLALTLISCTPPEGSPPERSSNSAVGESTITERELRAHLGFLYRVVLDIAQDSTFPNWNEGSEFKGARDAMMGR
jgi:hypothetical protein